MAYESLPYSDKESGAAFSRVYIGLSADVHCDTLGSIWYDIPDI